MADDSATIVVNPLPPRRRDEVIAHLAAPTTGAEVFYFIEYSGEIATSPIRAGDFVSLLASGRVTPSTLVWAQSLGEWTALHNVPTLASVVALASAHRTAALSRAPEEQPPGNGSDVAVAVGSAVTVTQRLRSKHFTCPYMILIFGIIILIVGIRLKIVGVIAGGAVVIATAIMIALFLAAGCIVAKDMCCADLGSGGGGGYGGGGDGGGGGGDGGGGDGGGGG